MASRAAKISPKKNWRTNQEIQWLQKQAVLQNIKSRLAKETLQSLILPALVIAEDLRLTKITSKRLKSRFKKKVVLTVLSLCRVVETPAFRHR